MGGNGQSITFYENGHFYLDEFGVIVPSVSDVIDFAFPNKYRSIPLKILECKARYGTALHSCIEKILIGKKLKKSEVADANIKATIEYFKKLNKVLKIKPKEIEKLGTYKGLIAGTCDIITETDDIIDIKTTSKLFVDNETLQAPLNLQISLYYLINGIKKKKGYALWLPKDINPLHLITLELRFKTEHQILLTILLTRKS